MASGYNTLVNLLTADLDNLGIADFTLDVSCFEKIKKVMPLSREINRVGGKLLEDSTHGQHDLKNSCNFLHLSTQILKEMVEDDEVRADFGDIAIKINQTVNECWITSFFPLLQRSDQAIMCVEYEEHRTEAYADLSRVVKGMQDVQNLFARLGLSSRIVPEFSLTLERRLQVIKALQNTVFIAPTDDNTFRYLNEVEKIFRIMSFNHRWSEQFIPQVIEIHKFIAEHFHSHLFSPNSRDRIYYSQKASLMAKIKQHTTEFDWSPLHIEDFDGIPKEMPERYDTNKMAILRKMR